MNTVELFCRWRFMQPFTQFYFWDLPLMSRLNKAGYWESTQIPYMVSLYVRIWKFMYLNIEKSLHSDITLTILKVSKNHCSSTLSTFLFFLSCCMSCPWCSVAPGFLPSTAASELHGNWLQLDFWASSWIYSIRSISYGVHQFIFW